MTSKRILKGLKDLQKDLPTSCSAWVSGSLPNLPSSDLKKYLACACWLCQFLYRKVSNQESARRSRKRRQSHLTELET